MTFAYRPHAGDPPVDPTRCAASVGHGDRAPVFLQCARLAWQDGWCKQHHPDRVRARALVTRRAEALRSARRWARCECAQCRQHQHDAEELAVHQVQDEMRRGTQ